jgi:hypothetical protein
MRRFAVLTTVLILSMPVSRAQQPRATTAAGAHITTPKEAFGFNFGDDYQLATYKLYPTVAGSR